MPEVVGNTEFSSYKLMKETWSKEDELKNLYFKHEYEKVSSLADQRARESFKTAIELHLEENISHTSNIC